MTKVYIIINSHINDLLITNGFMKDDRQRLMFIKWLVFYYKDLTTEIDAELEFKTFNEKYYNNLQESNSAPMFPNSERPNMKRVSISGRFCYWDNYKLFVDEDAQFPVSLDALTTNQRFELLEQV